MRHPDISVIIPTFNNGHELERAILSVLQQNALHDGETPVEIIIINDCSADEYSRYLQQLAERHSCIHVLLNQKQLGPAGTRNVGIKQAHGNIIGFLDADDEWPLNKLTLLLPFFDDQETEIVCGKVQYVLDNGQPLPNLTYEDDQQRLTHVHLGALLARRTVFDKGFLFDEALRFSEDVDWWLNIRESGIHITIVEETTLLYHLHGQNMSIKRSIGDLQLLKVLHKSLQRRRENARVKNVPQVKDFRIQRDAPLISVIIPLYNGRRFLRRTLGSIAAQTYNNIEVCIVDDGSTDGGAEYAKGLYPAAKIIYQENAGVAAARNTGIRSCAGELVAFLDQDDEWVPDKLYKQWALLKQHPYITFVTCNQLFKCEEDTTLPEFFKEASRNAHRSFIPGAILIRRHALLAIGGFDEILEVGSDVDLVRKLRNAGFAEDNIDIVLLNKWYHGENASLDKEKGVKDILTILRKQLNGT